ncbi:putative BSD domain-containing protein [Tanacetum coccineum]
MTMTKRGHLYRKLKLTAILYLLARLPMSGQFNAITAQGSIDPGRILHALTVESLAPRLAALRIELCAGYMSESSFWKIYFVLLHPRLEPPDAELFSTPEETPDRFMDSVLGYEKEKMKCREIKHKSSKQASSQSLVYADQRLGSEKLFEDG